MESIIKKLGKTSVTVEKNYHSSEKEYNKLTIVEEEGTFKTYLSRKPVPVGIALTNREYWICFSGVLESITFDYLKFKKDYASGKAIEDNAIITRHILNRNIERIKIALKAISEEEIDDNAIIERTIKDRNITSNKIAQENILTEHFAKKSVITTILADYAITSIKLADDSVTTRSIVNENITQEKLAKNSVTESKIANNAININKFDSYTRNIIESVKYIPKEFTLLKEAIFDEINKYKPIIINGDVTNAADEEDITSENNLLKLKDRSALNGMGYVILRKNKSFAEQVTKENTIYEIRYNFDLNGAEITIPENCVLKFNGGSLSNGTINGNYAKIEAETLDNVLINIKYTSPVKFNKLYTYYIIPKVWGIIEGYIEKGEDGHYTEEQYDIMYKNGVGFTKAIEYASNNGFNKVVFPKGKYCFTPFDSVIKYRLSNSIWIHDLYNFDIDLNSSELYFLIDSTQKSKYVTFDYGSIWDIRGCLIGISTCENLNIHNGTIIGDRLIRTYADEKEKWAEGTYGIGVNGININIKISDIDVSNFMGDGIAASMHNMVQIDYKANITNKSTDNLLRKKSEGMYNVKNNNIVNELIFKQVGSSITDFIDTDSLITDNYLKHNLFKRYRKFFRITGSGGYTRLANCYCPNIDVLVYDSNAEDAKVIRIIPCSFLEDFQLYDYERYIKLQFIKDFDIPDEGITSNLAVTVKGADGLTIENCYIHNNHRGNFSGSINNTTIRKCVFEKALTYNQGVGIIDYPDSTNYNIDIEDSFCKGVTVHDCEFKGVAKNDTLFGCYDLHFYNNRCNKIPGIYSNIFSDIYDNVFKSGSTFNINSVLVAENTIGGRSKLQRYISIHNNYIYSLNLNNVFLNDIRNTTVSFNDNTCFINNQFLWTFNKDTETVAKYVIENSSFIATNNRIFFCADEYTTFVVMGRWTNNYFLNKFGTFNRYKNILTAGDFINNVVDLTNCRIKLGEFRNNIIIRQSFSNYAELVRDSENEYIYKIFSNITIKDLSVDGSMASNSTIEFRDCNITISDAHSTMVNKDNSTLIFNRCNFNTDKKYIVSCIQSIPKDKNCKLILKDCTLNNKPWSVDVVFALNEKNPVCIRRGTSTQRPLYVEDDFLYYDTTLKKYIRWNGEEWTNTNGTSLE